MQDVPNTGANTSALRQRAAAPGQKSGASAPSSATAPRARIDAAFAGNSAASTRTTGNNLCVTGDIKGGCPLPAPRSQGFDREFAGFLRAQVGDLLREADALASRMQDDGAADRDARTKYHDAAALAFLAGIDHAVPVLDAIHERGIASETIGVLRALAQAHLGRMSAVERLAADTIARGGANGLTDASSLAQGLLSVAQRHAGALSAAAETLSRVIDSETQRQRPEGVATAKASLALTWSEQGFTEKAAIALEEAARLAETYGFDDVTALTAFERGRVAFERGDWAQSRAFLDDASRLYHDLRDVAGASRTAEMLGRLMIEAGDRAGAERQFTRALAAAERAGLRALAARAALELAQLCEEAGDLTSACDFWLRAREIYESVGNRAAIGPLEDKMRGAGCPTDWVLNDF